MRRGTTPVVDIDVDADLSDCEFYVTFACHGKLLTKGRESCELSDDGMTVSVRLDQQDTLQFTFGYPVKVQVRFKDRDGNAFATDIAETTVEQVLYEEVI